MPSEAADRKRSQNDIVQALNKNFQKYNFGLAYAVQEQTIAVQRSGGGGSQPISFVIQNIDFDKLSGVVPRFLDEKAGRVPKRLVIVNH